MLRSLLLSSLQNAGRRFRRVRFRENARETIGGFAERTGCRGIVSAILQTVYGCRFVIPNEVKRNAVIDCLRIAHHKLRIAKRAEKEPSGGGNADDCAGRTIVFREKSFVSPIFFIFDFVLDTSSR